MRLIMIRLKRNDCVRGEFPVVPEIDHVPAALTGSAHATQSLGVYRQQILVSADRHEIIICRRLYRVQRKRSWEILRRKLDPQRAISLPINPDRTSVFR